MESEKVKEDFPAIIQESELLEVGVIIYAPHPKANLGQHQKINFWIDDRGVDWDVEKGTGNVDLAILTAYKLMQNWGAEIRLLCVVRNEDKRKLAVAFLKSIVELARLPITDLNVLEGDFLKNVKSGPYADINIFSLNLDTKISYCAEMVDITNTSCLFIKDSGHENILA